MPDFFFYVACGAIQDRGTTNESGSGTGVFTPGLSERVSLKAPFPILPPSPRNGYRVGAALEFRCLRHTRNFYAVSVPGLSRAPEAPDSAPGRDSGHLSSEIAQGPM